MELFVGLDVSVRTTSVCVMDTGGKLIRESKVETELEAIGALLHAIGGPYQRVGLEAGPLSQWLYSGLSAAGYPVICVETRHMNAALSAQINKTDRNDARGIISGASKPFTHQPSTPRPKPRMVCHGEDPFA
ncbi:transposase [Mesorhizobium sp. M0895]|uniref:IS110 family transposase n=1 Tax=Mesorhizobium sp. M0895 TaxID=2957019 RepID=UPI003336180E